jgi:hypothetical protein
MKRLKPCRLNRDSVIERLRTAYLPHADGLVPVYGLETMLINSFRAKVFELCELNRTYTAQTLGISLRAFRLWLEDMRVLGYTWPTQKGGGKASKRPQPRPERIEQIRRYAAKYQRSLSKRRVKE